MIDAALSLTTTTDIRADIRADIIAAQAGDNAAFHALYERHATPVYNLVLRSTGNREDANDVCQDVWITVHKQLPSLREHSAFGVWLRRIASRACIDFARRRRSRPEIAVEDFGRLEVEGEASPEEIAVTRERAILAWDALGNLAPRQGIALFLREVEGYSYRDIAATLGITVDAVETLLFRARNCLLRNLDTIETSPEKRCSQVRKIVSAVIDGETSKLARLTAEAHVSACPNCHRVTEDMRRASSAYLGIPLAAGSSVAPLTFATGVTGNATGLSAIAGVIAQLKAALVPLTAATTVAATAAVGVSVVEPDVFGLGASSSGTVALQESAPTQASPAISDSVSQQAGVSPAGGPASPFIAGDFGASLTLDTMPPAIPLEMQSPSVSQTSVAPVVDFEAPGTPLVQGLQEAVDSTLPVLPQIEALLPQLPLPVAGSLLPELLPLPLPEVELPPLPLVNQPLNLPLPSLPPVSVPPLTSPAVLPPVSVPGLPPLPTGSQPGIPLPSQPTGSPPIQPPVPGIPPVAIPPILPTTPPLPGLPPILGGR
jgi:RNA polymerase sigma-70 factor (ECF subfamily)